MKKNRQDGEFMKKQKEKEIRESLRECKDESKRLSFPIDSFESIAWNKGWIAALEFVLEEKK